MIGLAELLVVLGLLMEPGQRPCVPLAADERLSVDMSDTPLFDVARLVSCALERNLLFQPPTLGDKRVTVLAARPVGARDLERLWQALLADHGLVEETHGAFAVVRPAKKL